MRHDGCTEYTDSCRGTVRIGERFVEQNLRTHVKHFGVHIEKASGRNVTHERVRPVRFYPHQ